MERSRKLDASTKTMVRFAEAIIEVCVLAVLYYFFWRNGYEEGLFPPYQGNGKYVLTGVYAILSWLFIKNSDGFMFGNLRKFDLGIAQWFALLLVDGITYFQLCLIGNIMVSPLPMAALYIVDGFASVSFVFIYDHLYHVLYTAHHMLMIYGRDEAVGLKLKLDTCKERYDVYKMLPADESWKTICDEIDKAESVVVSDVPAQKRNDILKYCYQNQVRFYTTPKITDILIRGANSIEAIDTPMLLVKGGGLTIGQRFFKRTMDIVLSLLAIVPVSPIMLITALAIHLDDHGPVFYRQRRVTIEGKEFDILKFRSMIVDAEKAGHPVLAAKRDPRITRVGRFIRATRIDELPQLFNILKGDMSIVGPRPERVMFIEKYAEEIPEFVYRLKVKGGLTGYAQIYGKYNTSAYDKLRLDLMYIENYSLLLDIKLMLLTVRVLFSKSSTEGVDAAGSSTEKQQELLESLCGEQINDGEH